MIDQTLSHLKMYSDILHYIVFAVLTQLKLHPLNIHP